MRLITKKIRNIINDMDKPLLFVTIVFFIFGLLNIVTASSREAVSLNVPLYYYFFKQSEMLLIGLVGAIFIINFDTRKYYKYAFIAFVVITVLLLYSLAAANETRGALNWINLFGFTFQPSEFAKPVIIVCLALIFEKTSSKLRDKSAPHRDIIATIIVAGCAIPAIIFLQKDFGTMFIIFCIFLVMFFASPILRIEKVKTIGLLTGLVFVAGFMMFSIKGHILTEAQLARFSFFNPCSDYEHGGYQVCNGFIAINDGGLFGLGIGKSKQKYSYIPEPHTDLVFSIIAEEYGLLKVFPIFIVYLFILYRILNLSSKANTIRGRYMCLGVATYIFMHILVNLGGLFGVMPLTGVSLPFLSYGGSFTITLMCSLALVQRVHIETRNQKIKIK
jgi:cell division protein FtsW